MAVCNTSCAASSVVRQLSGQNDRTLPYTMPSRLRVPLGLADLAHEVFGITFARGEHIGKVACGEDLRRVLVVEAFAGRALPTSLVEVR